MKRTLFRKYRRLRLESLEPRQMLAGDVTVSVTGGNLSIVGDSEMNRITITATTTAGEFVVEGSNTTVNGGLSATVSGVVGDVTIDLGDDYDFLTFDTDPAAFHFAGDVHIDLGQGYPGYLAMHTLTVTGSNVFSVAGSLDVITGFNTVAEIDNAFIGGDFHLTVSNEIHGVELRGGSIAGDLTIEGNAGSVTVGDFSRRRPAFHLNRKCRIAKGRGRFDRSPAHRRQRVCHNWHRPLLFDLMRCR